MVDETSPPFFTHLSAEYEPECVTFTIKLMPPGDVSFSIPPNDIVKELGPIMNYILFRFSGRTAPVSPVEASSQGKIGPIKKVDRQQARMAKTLDGSANRALQVLEQDLKLAKDGKDPKAIERATLALTRGKSQKKKTEEEHADE